MILLGHKYFPSEPLYKVKTWEDVKSTPANATVLIDFTQENFFDMIQNCNKNSVKFALLVSNIKEVVFAYNFKASYILVEKSLAKSVQNIANEYLFDGKILVTITQEDEIEELALLGVDGAVFPQAIKEL